MFLSCKDNTQVFEKKTFRLERNKNHSLLTFFYGSEEKKYLLLPKKNEIPQNLNYDRLIRIPIDKVVVTSTTHVAALEILGLEEKLVAFPGTDYISSPKTRTLIEQDKITNLGTQERMNIETFIKLNPDLLLTYSVDSDMGIFNENHQVKCPIIIFDEWKAKDPIERLHWLIPLAALFGKENRAVKIVDSITQRYDKIKSKLKDIKDLQTVISGSVFNGVWYAPSGDSWSANLIKDAKGKYLWKDKIQHGSLKLNFENVLLVGGKASHWIAAGQYTSYREMLGDNSNYQYFKSFKQKTISTYSKTKGANGGLLFFETGPIQPDVILNDMAYLLHPHMFEHYVPKYLLPLD